MIKHVLAITGFGRAWNSREVARMTEDCRAHRDNIAKASNGSCQTELVRLPLQSARVSGVNSLLWGIPTD